jgi:hypothetical protein
MKSALVFLAAVVMVAPASAQTLDRQAPAKPRTTVTELVPQPRQGGDTIATALPIPALPFSDVGTTVGYNDDADEACPYPGSVAPDVFYTFTPTGDEVVNIDLCGSDYDTKLYVYDGNLDLVACNDDYYAGPPCGQYVSLIEMLTLYAGTTYYIVVDGYGSAAGNYQLAIGNYEECLLSCAGDDALEGEPPLQDDQENLFNGGCGGEDEAAFQELPGDADGEHRLCATGGWFRFFGLDLRDTDWFTATVGPGGVVHVDFWAHWPTYLFHLAPTECATVGVAQMVTSDCEEVTMDVTGTPGEVIWLWTGATTFTPPNGGNTPYEFPYELRLSGLMPVVAVEATTWSAVKSLYR